MDQKLKEKLSVKSKWVRLLYMILFLFIAILVKFTVLFITAFQFISILFTDHPNQMLLEFGEPLSIYIGQIFRFLSYNTESKPYPMAITFGKTFYQEELRLIGLQLGAKDDYTAITLGIREKLFDLA